MIEALMVGKRLYHGSYCEVRVPDLKRCAAHKDFGRGFYLTSDFAQARDFAKISTVKAIRRRTAPPDQGFGVVTTFDIREIDELHIHVYQNADIEWLRAIVGHRVSSKEGVSESDVLYDVVAGKIANDNTNATLLAYMSGLYGTVGSEEAERTCIGLLLPERLKDQYCFRTDRAIGCLVYKGTEKIWI